MQVFYLTVEQSATGKRWILSVLANDIKQAHLLAKRAMPDAEITGEQAGPKRPEVFDIKAAGEAR